MRKIVKKCEAFLCMAAVIIGVTALRFQLFAPEVLKAAHNAALSVNDAAEGSAKGISAGQECVQ